jgi:hypothetical protein
MDAGLKVRKVTADRDGKIEIEVWAPADAPDDGSANEPPANALDRELQEFEQRHGSH